MAVQSWSNAGAAASARARGEIAAWVPKLARVGYLAKGVVYLVLGYLALQVTLSGGSAPTSRDALRTLREQPFGEAIVMVMIAGLAGYVIWRLTQAALDPEHPGSGSDRIPHRIGYLASAALYGVLAVGALPLVGVGDGGGGSEGWFAQLMSSTWGRWAVGLAGLITIGYGLYRLYQAFAADIAKRMGFDSASRHRIVVKVGRFGIGARGVVFAITGGLVAWAAWQYQPDDAPGLGAALATLRDQPYGPWLVGVAALGLVAYGVWQLAKARYRRIHA